MVGQEFVTFLEGHPWFDITWLGASDRSAGKPYRDATNWRLDGAMPAGVRSHAGGRVQARQRTATGFFRDGRFGGHRNRAGVRRRPATWWYRTRAIIAWMPDVPLLIPEVNPDHLKIIPLQQRRRGWKGQIATNPNCSTMVLAMALAPLKQFGITRVMATTMQALSGAGYPGVASLDINGNVIPYIGGEEEKMQRETQKILGDFTGDSIRPLAAKVSAQCNRVPVVDGHMVATSVELERKPGTAESDPGHRKFQQLAAAAQSCPARRRVPLIYLTEHDRPQPRRDVERERGHDCVRRPRARMPGAGL